MEDKLYEMIKVAENSNRIVKTAKQQIGHVMKQLPVYSGYYCLELSKKKGGTDYLPSGECRIVKDLYTGNLFAANENWIPTQRLTRQDCVRVAMNLRLYDYGKKVHFRAIGKDMSFQDYAEVYVSSELHEFYMGLYYKVVEYLYNEGGIYHSEKFGDFVLCDEGVDIDLIKWNDKYVPCFPSVMSIDAFKYTTNTFLEKSSFVLVKIFEEFSQK